MTAVEEIRAALIDGRDAEVRRLAEEGLVHGLTATDLLSEGLIAGMNVVGERFRTREIFLPDVLLAARAMHAGLDVLRPLLEASVLTTKGTVILGTVEGDLHDIGKNLVGILLRGAGYEVVDLGHNVAAARFVAEARERGAQVVGMSALLTTTMPAMERVVAALREAGLGEVRTMIGGAPVTEEFARRIGAHAYGFDAARAVELVKSWLP